jgi:signal transduction histidine kinase
MFKKLRNKFLILNLSITSGVITLAFGFVYFITYSNLQADIRDRLHASPEAQMRVAAADNPSRPTEPTGSQSAVRHAAAEGTNTFHAEVDAEGRIVNIESTVHLPEEVYRQLVEIAWNNRDDHEAIKTGNKQWRYAVSPIRVQVIGEDGIPLAVEQHNYSILFLDVTEMYGTLAQLLTTLLLVGVGTLAVIFAVSLYYANRAIQPIREAWDKQKQFVADASHELKTPLSIIQANCDALAANPEDAIRNQMKWVEYIRAGTNRMAKLVNDLLTLAGTDDGHTALQNVQFNLSDAVDHISRSMEAAAMSKNLSVTRSIEPGLIAKGDPDGVRQAVEILLDNAVKYANPGGWIVLSLTRTGRRIEFAVANSGPGIAKEDLPRVFDRFFRADRSRTHQDGSYGLGLSIAQSIIKRHGSEIKVKSAENASTTFSFSIESQ